MLKKFNFNQHSFKAGYRYENVSYAYSDIAQNLKDDNALNGVELGYNYMLDTQKSIFFNYAHAYQAPDVDRFFSYGGAFNGFINPMTSDSFTLGYNHITAVNKFKISAYYVDLTDEINYDLKDGLFLNTAVVRSTDTPSSLIPFRAGSSSFITPNKEIHHIKTLISTPKITRSSRDVNIEIQSQKNSYVLVSVVDEGILQI